MIVILNMFLRDNVHLHVKIFVNNYSGKSYSNKPGVQKVRFCPQWILAKTDFNAFSDDVYSNMEGVICGMFRAEEDLFS
jgi:hypothetical protein